MRAALARRTASIMMNISIRLWFVGGQVDWTMNTSSPRTFSSTFTNVSPSGNGEMLHLPSSMPMYLQIARARGSLAVPLKTFTSQKLFLVKQENRRCRRVKLRGDFNSERGWRKRKLTCTNSNQRPAWVCGQKQDRSGNSGIEHRAVESLVELARVGVHEHEGRDVGLERNPVHQVGGGL